MRLGNAEDARVAAEQIGTEHRFLVSQLTDTVGMSLTDTIGVSYTSTVGTADSVTGSDSVTSTTGRSSRPQPAGRLRAVCRLHWVSQPGSEFLGGVVRLAVYHGWDQRWHVVGLEHVTGRRQQRFGGQDQRSARASLSSSSTSFSSCRRAPSSCATRHREAVRCCWPTRIQPSWRCRPPRWRRALRSTARRQPADPAMAPATPAAGGQSARM